MADIHGRGRHPDWASHIRSRLSSSRLPAAREAEIVDELSQDLDDRYRDALATGLTPEEAQRTALDGFQSRGALAEGLAPLRLSRAAPTLTPAAPTGGRGADLWHDVRCAARVFTTQPGFATTAVLTLALGIGASVAMFSVLNAVILRPLPYPQPERLMVLENETPALRATGQVSPPEYFEFTELTRSFSAVGAFQVLEMNLAALDRPRRVATAGVTGELFEALAVPPLRGRWFRRDEARLPAPAIAVLSHGLWQSAFAGRDLVGETIEVNGVRRQVVGIMPPEFDVMDSRVELFLPAPLNRANRQNRGNHLLTLIGRLKDGVTPDQARAELASLLATWGERTGASGHLLDTNTHSLRMKPLHGEVVGSAGRAIGVLQVAVAFVLLIACANFAHLLLARCETRRREFAVRTALGAGRWRLLRQFVTEGTMLSVAGATLGVALAWLAVRSLIRAFPDGWPRATEVAIDRDSLAFALLLAVGTGVLVSLAPLLSVSKIDLDTTLKDGGTRGTARAGQRLRRLLVAAEVALAVILTAGAGLMLRSVGNLVGVHAGFDPSRLVTFTTAFPAASYPTYARRLQAYDRLVSALRATPGVERVSGMSGLPPLRQFDVNDTTFSNFTAVPGGPPAQVDFYQRVEPEYFETMGIPIVEGRPFGRLDLQGPPVAVVNETLARLYWPGMNPLGQTIAPCCNNPTYTVVGVARDVRQSGVDQAPGSEAYFFDRQRAQAPNASGGGVLHVVIRTALPVAALRPVVERAVRDADPSLPIARLRQMDDVFSETLSPRRLLADLLSGFASLALLLTAIGAYGVLSYTVAERRRDIGVRMALGAGQRQVIGEVMRQGLAPALAGLAIGVGGALVLTRLMTALLFGIQPHDPATLAWVALVIAAVAIAACVLPARRASRVDPLVVLRNE